LEISGLNKGKISVCGFKSIRANVSVLSQGQGEVFDEEEKTVEITSYGTFPLKQKLSPESTARHNEAEETYARTKHTAIKITQPRRRS
jgi:hypothetical protein